MHFPCSLFPTQYNLMNDGRWVLTNGGMVLWLSFNELLSNSYTFRPADVMTICFIWSKLELILVRKLRVKLSSFHFSQWFIYIYIFFLSSLMKYKIYSKEQYILIFNIELHKLVILTLWQNMVHWWGDLQTPSVFLPWEPHEQYEKAKRCDTERWTSQVGRCPICPILGKVEK